MKLKETSLYILGNLLRYFLHGVGSIKSLLMSEIFNYDEFALVENMSFK